MRLSLAMRVRTLVRALLLLLVPIRASADNVLVPEDVQLQPTKDAALVARGRTTGKPIAMRLVRDLGDVVELQTGEVVDCADSRDTPYKLTVFVNRLHLYGRLKNPVKQTFSDGTALVFDRGAPGHGLEWAQRPADPKNITIAVPGALGKAELPRAGTQLVCDGGAPSTLDEWMAKERTRAKPAKPAPAKPQDDASRFADMLTQEPPRMPPPCGVRDNILPKVDDKTVVWPSPHVFPASVSKVGDAYFADVHLFCGRARMRIEKADIGERGGGAGLGGIGGGGKRTVWIPRPGPVTWQSGQPAGRYNGHVRYTDVVEDGGRICVEVEGVAERVCHKKATTKQE